MNTTLFKRFVLGAAFATVGCEKPELAPKPPVAEFLLAAGDSTYWVRSGADGMHVRTAPILLTLVDNRFYEVFISDDARDYDEASFVSARAFSRDILKTDSLMVFADGRVEREAFAWQRAHPKAVPLDPSDDDDSVPPSTVVSDDIEVVDVHGPWLSFSYRLDVDVAGQKKHEHRKRNGVLDVRTGAVASLHTLFGDDDATRVQTQARKAFADIQDSVHRTTDDRGEAARQSLKSFVFDSMNFAITDRDKRPAVAYQVGGFDKNGDALSLFLPAIETSAPSWWPPVLGTIPRWNADSTVLRWTKNNYDVVARPASDADVLSIVITFRNSAGEMRSWPVATVASPVYQLISLDLPAIDSVTRAALTRAFDHSSLQGGFAHQASWRPPTASSNMNTHVTTLRECLSPPRPSATHTRHSAFRIFGAISSACLRSHSAFKFRAQ
ncbi:MAG: hypothetical protein ABJC26_01910 [Gemmatimonadaceae bacterium]